MKNYTLVTIIGLSVIISFLLGYEFGAYRPSQPSQQLKADILSAFSQTPFTGTLTASSSLAATSTATSTISTSSPYIVSLLTSSSSPVNFYTVGKKMQYKLATNIDPCTLERLSNDGWQIFTAGSATNDMPNLGYNIDCQTRSYIGIDWAIFQRER